MGIRPKNPEQTGSAYRRRDTILLWLEKLDLTEW